MITKAELEKLVEVEAQKIAEESFGEYDSLEDEEANAFMAIVSDFKSGCSFVTGILMPEIERVENNCDTLENKAIFWMETNDRAIEHTESLQLTITTLKTEIQSLKDEIEVMKEATEVRIAIMKALGKKLSEAHATIQSLKDEIEDCKNLIKFYSISDVEGRRLWSESCKQIQSLKDEIEVLRRYGNKDCTAMADEALTKKAEE